MVKCNHYWLLLLPFLDEEAEFEDPLAVDDPEAAEEDFEPDLVEELVALLEPEAPELAPLTAAEDFEPDLVEELVALLEPDAPELAPLAADDELVVLGEDADADFDDADLLDPLADDLEDFEFEEFEARDDPEEVGAAEEYRDLFEEAVGLDPSAVEPEGALLDLLEPDFGLDDACDEDFFVDPLLLPPDMAALDPLVTVALFGFLLDFDFGWD